MAVAGADVRVTLKLEPSLPTTDGIANAWSAELAIVIAWAFDCERLTVWPFSTAVAPVNGTVPKLSSGTMVVALPLTLAGASSIHSADDWLEEYCTLV